MRYPLRTLWQIRNLRRASGGKLGAEQAAVCDTCGTRWSVDLMAAQRALGEEATSKDLINAANCPRCTGGKAGQVYVVIDDRPQQKPVWFGGLFEQRLDGVDVHATEKPRRKNGP